MKVIHTIPGLHQEAAGPSYSVVRLCESLVAHGMTVELAATEPGMKANPPAFLRTFPRGWGPAKLGGSPAMRRWLHARAAGGSLDLMHTHSLWMMPNVYPGQVSRRFDVPLVVSPRGTLAPAAMQTGSRVKRLFWPLVQRPVIERAACLHATSAAEYEDIRRLGLKQPVAVIPNGIDLPLVALRKPADQRTLLFLGRIHPIKGIDLLIKAWSIVASRFPDWRLKIVGPDNGGHLAEIRRLAESLRTERVTFVGPLFGADKMQAIADADLFVLPTHSENFGVAVAESLAVRTPVIVTKGAPWGGLPLHGAGWWIDIGVAPLVAALEIALDKPHAELAAMGERGRAWMQEEYAWDQLGMRMGQTYRWLTGTGDKPQWVWES